MNIEQMNESKKELGLSYERIAELSELPLSTVQKVLGGFTKSPRQSTLQKLEKVFIAESHPVNYLNISQSLNPSNMICDPPAYRYHKNQGSYTTDDYFNIPDDRRVELIDGVIYDMASPTSIHQMLVSQIWNALFEHIQENHGECIPLISPIDVQLDLDDKTIVQPDVAVICNRDQIKDHIYGAPDFVAEILSPSSKKIDNVLKVRKYSAAGVKEYWIVDPVQKKILTYYFTEGDWPTIYGFEDHIPVHTFPEAWDLDFSKIYEYIKFMYME